MDIDKEISKEILLANLDELVDYLRDRFKQPQVIIMGYSWGTLFGSKYVLENPNKVCAYIGLGQVISFKEGYVYSAIEAIKKANENYK